MTNQEKKIREDWRQFQKQNEMNNKIFLSNEDITKVMSKLFG